MDYALEMCLFFSEVKAVGRWLVAGEEGGGEISYLGLGKVLY